MSDRKNETQVDETEIRDTDISFDCPYCGKNHVIDFRGAGREVHCSDCGKAIFVPFPEGIEPSLFDIEDKLDILRLLFVARRNSQRAELEIKALKARLTQIQETLGVIQSVIAEGIAG